MENIKQTKKWLDQQDKIFLFYNNYIDTQANLDHSLLSEINPYQFITKSFGKEFCNKLRSLGNPAMNLQRLGVIDQSLKKFEDVKGFSKLLKMMNQISKKIILLPTSDPNFKNYLNQFYRYFSELSFPKIVSEKPEVSVIEIQPSSKRKNNCDHILKLNEDLIFVEITTLNTNNPKTLALKINDIFTKKAQLQLKENEKSLLIIDITSSGVQQFDQSDHRFHVEFPVFDLLVELIKTELNRSENNHLIGVIIFANMILIDDLGKVVWKLNAISNRNNQFYKLTSDLLPKI